MEGSQIVILTAQYRVTLFHRAEANRHKHGGNVSLITSMTYEGFLLSSMAVGDSALNVREFMLMLAALLLMFRNVTLAEALTRKAFRRS